MCTSWFQQQSTHFKHDNVTRSIILDKEIVTIFLLSKTKTRSNLVLCILSIKYKKSAKPKQGPFPNLFHSTKVVLAKKL